ncbi:hypothetical protein [Citrobacter portucalensis]|uniref:hypothetical protein n=1 Tax=Citrobacter portucalensis TaxID=1639133 RepID=UPI000A4220EC|nr:hypothetical protein [Citrobacter portucalensis]
MTTNHPANGPVSLDRLHQISEILSKAAAQSDGGNLGYAMADAVKVIDGVLEARNAETGVPDEYRHLSELYHAQVKRLFKLAQRIKGPSFDKYAHSPSQAIDVLEAAIFGDSEDACRAAMLQSFDNSEQLDEVGSWNNHMNTPTANPAIDTGELLKHIEGMEVSVDVSTCDTDAGHRYFGTVTEISELDAAKNGYILLVQDAKPNFKQAGNSPVAPDGWKVEAERLAEIHGCSFFVFRHGEEPQCADSTKVIISFTDEGLGHHSAAPQQEVK